MTSLFGQLFLGVSPQLQKNKKQKHLNESVLISSWTEHKTWLFFYKLHKMIPVIVVKIILFPRSIM